MKILEKWSNEVQQLVKQKEKSYEKWPSTQEKGTYKNYNEKNW